MESQPLADHVLTIGIQAFLSAGTTTPREVVLLAVASNFAVPTDRSGEGEDGYATDC